jgi:O-antigen ligase
MGLVVAGGLLIGLVLTTSGASGMMAVRLNRGGLQDYDRVRFATQRLALQTAEERPLGVGPGQAEVVFQYSTHSLYMRVLSENGMVALLALLVFIAATAWRAVQLARYAPDRWVRDVNLAAFASIAGHMVNSAVIDTVHWRHIWFILALPWACTLPQWRRVQRVVPPPRFAPSRAFTQISNALEE